jgi:hypothetical protein
MMASRFNNYGPPVYSHDKHLIKRHFGMRYGYATTRGLREKIVWEEWE